MSKPPVFRALFEIFRAPDNVFSYITAVPVGPSVTSTDHTASNMLAIMHHLILAELRTAASCVHDGGSVISRDHLTIRRPNLDT